MKDLPAMFTASQAAIDIDQLSLEFDTRHGVARVLNGVSLRLEAGEIVGIVGESGSGKSVLALSCLRLLPKGTYRVTGGSITLLGQDVFTLSSSVLEEMRGAQAAMVFQEPMNALNPSFKIGHQMVEVIRRHKRVSKAEAHAAALALLADMAFHDPAEVMRSYPTALSGGMRQRVLLAMAFSCHPGILIADEPTTALDVTVQAQILGLIKAKARALGTSVLFITHDMAVVHQLCDRVYVLYAGEVMESGPAEAVLKNPYHPYTQALLNAMPANHVPKSELPAIGGTVPSVLMPYQGCRFQSRCPHAFDRCAERPEMTEMGSGRRVACFYAAGKGK